MGTIEDSKLSGAVGQSRGKPGRYFMSLNRIYEVLRSPVKTVSFRQKQGCKHDKEELDAIREAKKKKGDTAILTYVDSVGVRRTRLVMRIAWQRVGEVRAIWECAPPCTATIFWRRITSIEYWNQLYLHYNEVVHIRSRSLIFIKQILCGVLYR